MLALNKENKRRSAYFTSGQLPVGVPASAPSDCQKGPDYLETRLQPA